MSDEKDGRGAEPAVYEVVVVGGSFAGLSAAIQLGRARRRVLIVDGGKPRNRFAKASHGFLGQDGKAPREIIETARRQVLAYPTTEFVAGEATDAAREKGESGLFRVAIRGGDGEERMVQARRLVLATGVVDQLPDIPGVRELWGEGVAHCPYCHGYELADRRLSVLMRTPEGGVHQAMLLRDWSEQVTLLTNGLPGLTAEDRNRLRARGVSIEEAPVARLLPDGEGSRELAAVEFRDGRRVPFGGMFLAPQVVLASSLAERLGCAIEKGMMGPMITTDTFKETTVPGIFAAGDAARAMHNVTFASADGVMAGSGAHRSLVFR